MKKTMQDKETKEYRIARLLDEYFTMKKDGGYLVVENLMKELEQEAERRGYKKAVRYMEGRKFDFVTSGGTSGVIQNIINGLSKLKQ